MIVNIKELHALRLLLGTDSLHQKLFVKPKSTDPSWLCFDMQRATLTSRCSDHSLHTVFGFSSFCISSGPFMTCWMAASAYTRHRRAYNRKCHAPLPEGLFFFSKKKVNLVRVFHSCGHGDDAAWPSVPPSGLSPGRLRVQECEKSRLSPQIEKGQLMKTKPRLDDSGDKVNSTGCFHIHKLSVDSRLLRPSNKVSTVLQQKTKTF